MMTTILEGKDVLSRLEKIAARDLNRAPPLLPSAHLQEEVAPDSLARLALITAIENEFRICIDDERAAELSTVSDVVALIIETAAQKEAS